MAYNQMRTSIHIFEYYGLKFASDLSVLTKFYANSNYTPFISKSQGFSYPTSSS